MSPLDGYDIAVLVAQAFERIGVDYFLGGSMASSLQGPPRFTNDIDFVANLRAHHVQDLKTVLGADFEVDEVALLECVKSRRSWNIFHTPTATRIDLFPVGPSEFDVEELMRRQRRDLGDGRSLFVKSPEDTVLRKLDWYRRGGEANGQQFRDAVGVLQFQGAALNQRYLDVWAPKVGVVELLARARAAAFG
ncbi:MAG: hypothetical protein SFW67_21075 [Myxococcaceae bacterium]|nr:hypothetical protein [Myxococcaceae bacterium]